MSNSESWKLLHNWLPKIDNVRFFLIIFGTAKLANRSVIIVYGEILFQFPRSIMLGVGLII